MAGGSTCSDIPGARNERIKPATRLLPGGRLLDGAQQPVNLDRFALPETGRAKEIPVVFVPGTAINSGKTTATAQLALGLRRAGYRVAALKGTGTGAFGDVNEYSDTGAHWVADFTDVGMVTTSREPLAREKVGLGCLLENAAKRGCDIAVVEIADGLFQRETRAPVGDPWLRRRSTGLIFACGDAIAAAGGVAELARHGLCPDALTGIASCSPMATAEAEAATRVPVLRKRDLADPADANGFALRARARSAGGVMRLPPLLDRQRLRAGAGRVADTGAGRGGGGGGLCHARPVADTAARSRGAGTIAPPMPSPRPRPRPCCRARGARSTVRGSRCPKAPSTSCSRSSPCPQVPRCRAGRARRDATLIRLCCGDPPARAPAVPSAPA